MFNLNTCYVEKESKQRRFYKEKTKVNTRNNTTKRFKFISSLMKNCTHMSLNQFNISAFSLQSIINKKNCVFTILFVDFQNFTKIKNFWKQFL